MIIFKLHKKTWPGNCYALAINNKIINKSIIKLIITITFMLII